MRNLISLFLIILLVVAVWTNPTPKTRYSTETISVKGKYYWELVFNYDNSQNSGTLTEEIMIRETKEIDKKQFLKNVVKVSSGFSFKSTNGFSVNYMGSTANKQLEYGFHVEASYEFERQSETSEKYTYERIHKRIWNIGPNSKLRLYRLCYQMDGALIKSDIVSTSTDVEITVDINYQITKRLLGFTDIEHQLLNTRPGRDNKGEWDNIRNSIISASAYEDLTRFNKLVGTLSTITPSNDNKSEWASIRSTCGQILNEWNALDKQDLLIKLLKQFSVTVPGSSNTAEWANIRNVSNTILNALTRKDFT